MSWIGGGQPEGRPPRRDLQNLSEADTEKLRPTL